MENPFRLATLNRSNAPNRFSDDYSNVFLIKKTENTREKDYEIYPATEQTKRNSQYTL